MSTPEREFDLVIIGGGPGGYVAAIKAAQSGLKTCLVEKEKVGGTCLHRGCIPTKSLLYSAYLYHLCKRSHEFGVKTSQVELDLALIRQRKEAVVERLHNGVRYLLKKNRIELIEAEGRITPQKTVLLFREGSEIGAVRGKNIILATGSVSSAPPWIPFDQRHVLGSDEILRMEVLPSSLIIAGGGDIGVEFGYLYNTLGTSVTVVEMKGSILPFAERDISAILQRTLTRRGMKFLTETAVEHVAVSNGRVDVEIKKKGGEKEIISAEKMLVALGRRPLTTGLGLEETGIALEKGFVKVNERFETSHSGIFAIGDLIGPPLLAHAASQEGISAVLQIAGKGAAPIDPKRVPSVNYCYPQVASVGLTSQEAEEKGYEIKTGKFPFSANSKAVISGEEEVGFVKVIAEKSYGEVLGIHTIGPDVSELIGGLSLAMSLEVTAADIANAIFPHPTLSEIIKEAAHAVEGQAIHI